MIEKEIKIEFTTLKKMLQEAYESGWYGTLELSEEAVEDIIEKNVAEDMFIKSCTEPDSMSLAMRNAQNFQLPVEL